jgi:hypothetical protein
VSGFIVGVGVWVIHTGCVRPNVTFFCITFLVIVIALSCVINTHIHIHNSWKIVR